MKKPKFQKGAIVKFDNYGLVTFVLVAFDYHGHNQIFSGMQLYTDSDLIESNNIITDNWNSSGFELSSLDELTEHITKS